jgi:hypothetical protein
MSIESIQSPGLGGQVPAPPVAVRGRQDAAAGPDAAVSAASGSAEPDRVELSPAARELVWRSNPADAPELQLSPEELRRLTSGQA